MKFIMEKLWKNIDVMVNNLIDVMVFILLDDAILMK
jgi:hypothetical protein